MATAPDAGSEIVAGRTSFLQRLSDGFLPPWLAGPLYAPLVPKAVAGADINGWSCVHAATGALAAWAGWSWWDTLKAHTLYWELGIQFLAGDNQLSEETMWDILWDTVFAMGGWAAMRRRLG